MRAHGKGYTLAELSVSLGVVAVMLGGSMGLAKHALSSSPPSPAKAGAFLAEWAAAAGSYARTHSAELADAVPVGGVLVIPRGGVGPLPGLATGPGYALVARQAVAGQVELMLADTGAARPDAELQAVAEVVGGHPDGASAGFAAVRARFELQDGELLSAAGDRREFSAEWGGYPALGHAAAIVCPSS